MNTSAFDLSDLDWSEHLQPPERRPIGDGIFIAEAIDRIGRAMIESWHAGVVAGAAVRDVPQEEVPDPDVAFERDRCTPIPQVHQSFGPAVRKVLSPGRWGSLKLKSEDRGAWLRGHLPDPVTGVPTPAGELRAATGADAADPIVYDNWLVAYEMSTIERGFRAVDVAFLDRAVLALTDLHREGKIALTAQAGGGAAPLPVLPSVWIGTHEHRMRIVASCTIDSSVVGGAPPPRPLPVFVRDAGFDAAVRKYADANFVPSIAPDHPWLNEVEAVDLDEALAQPPQHMWERFVVETLAVVEPLLDRVESRNWRRRDLKKLVTLHPALSNSHVSVLAEVRDRLLKQKRFEHLANGGQPRKEGRLVRMDDDEVRRLIRKG